MMKKLLLAIITVLLFTSQAFAQTDRREVRSGNRAFNKGEFPKAEVDYKKALLKDSTSVAAQYNLANALYKNENYTEAEKYAKASLDSLSRSGRAADAYYNNGDIYLQQRRWSEAIESFKESLRRNPGDMDAKSNLAYAQKMLQNEQQNQQNQDQNNDQNQDNQDQNNDQNQDQQDQNQDQNKDQNQDQNKDQNQDNQDQNNDQNQDQQDQNQDQNQDDKQDQQNGQQPKLTPDAAQQMLEAIQAKEDETQEKVKKEKAAAMKSRQKEKNW